MTSREVCRMKSEMRAGTAMAAEASRDRSQHRAHLANRAALAAANLWTNPPEAQPVKEEDDTGSRCRRLGDRSGRQIAVAMPTHNGGVLDLLSAERARFHRPTVAQIVGLGQCRQREWS